MQKNKATTPRYPHEFHKIKNMILLIFDFKCYVCGQKWHDLQVHHIDQDNQNTNPFNLVCVCGSCHNKLHTVMRIKELILTTGQRFLLERTAEFLRKYNY